jgi:putative transposase
MEESRAMENRQEIIRAVLHHLYQDNTKSGSHCKYNLCYHIVWITKYRRSFLKGKLAFRLKQILNQIAHNYGLNIIALEVMSDHVHMLIEAQPKWSPARLIGTLKGVSSRQMREEFLPVIRRHSWKDNTLWARGYYVSCVADSITTGMVKEYIQNQKKQDEVDSIQGELF